jgi:hypothetical protein
MAEKSSAWRWLGAAFSIKKKGITAMWKYIVKRLLWMIPVLLGISIVIFTIMYFCPEIRQQPF